MSGKAKRRDDDGASDADSEGHAPPKKSLKKDSDDDPDSITVCEVDFSLYYSISRISLFSFSFYLLFFYCVLITFCLRWNVDFEEQEGCREELERQHYGWHSRVLRQRWQAIAWQKRLLFSSFKCLFTLLFICFWIYSSFVCPCVVLGIVRVLGHIFSSNAFQSSFYVLLNLF